MIAQTRASLAAALDTADGVRGYARRPAAPKVGDAWPNLAGLERGPGQTLLTSWVVHLVLGTDEATAVDLGDAAAEAVFDALEVVAFVDSLTYVTLQQQNAGDVIALEIRVRC